MAIITAIFPARQNTYMMLLWYMRASLESTIGGSASPTLVGTNVNSEFFTSLWRAEMSKTGNFFRYPDKLVLCRLFMVFKMSVNSFYKLECNSINQNFLVYYCVEILNYIHVN
jgi:hypothetical protein